MGGIEGSGRLESSGGAKPESELSGVSVVEKKERKKKKKMNKVFRLEIVLKGKKKRFPCGAPTLTLLLSRILL